MRLINTIPAAFQATSAKKWPIHLLGHLLFFGMIALSLFYYQERLLAMDSAYYSFKMIVSETFTTGHERTISYIPQLLPLLALKWGWSLKAVLVIYSASFILFYYVAFNIIVYLFKNPRAGIFLALALSLSIRYKFYGPVGEVVLSIVYVGLLLGWLSKPKEQFSRLPIWLDIIIGCLLGSLFITGHPFVTIITAIALGFHLFYHKAWKDIAFWFTSLYTSAIFLFTFGLQERNEYETERINRMQEAWHVLGNLDDYYISQVFMSYFDTQYTFPIIVFGVALVLLVIKKRTWVSLYLLFSFLVLGAIILVMHAYLSSKILIMLDGYMTHLGVIWALPLAFDWLKKPRKWQLITLSGLLLFSLVRISDSSRFFTQRLAYLKHNISTKTSAEHPKGVAYFEDFDYAKLWIGWAMAPETLMISALDGPQNNRTIYLANNRGDLTPEKLEISDLFLSVHFGPEHIKPHHLPSRYFHLPAIPYREVMLDRKQN